jgi:ABC-type uncharacterized transport system substrate-binding protein
MTIRLPALIACLACATPALAHPHVWITARAELVYAPDGKVTGVRHDWTFDEAYSAMVTQGLDANNDGKLAPEELHDLAKTNAEALVDVDYFTVLKANGAKQAFDAPRDHGMVFEKGSLTLSFLLPLKASAKAGRSLALELYDPSFYVSFAIADGEDAIRLAGAPQGCAKTVTRPKPVDTAQQQRLSEAFFEALTAASNFGVNYANRVIVACP